MNKSKLAVIVVLAAALALVVATVAVTNYLASTVVMPGEEIDPHAP